MTIKFRLSAILMLVVMLFGMTMVSADERVLVNLSSVTDLRVRVVYSRTKPDITFISPGGNRIKEGNSAIKAFNGDGWTTYLIKNAEAGQWKADYEEKSNNEVKFEVIESVDNIAIQYFNFNGISDDVAKVSFKADIGSGGRYNYQIYLIEDNSPEYKEDSHSLTSGSANCGENVSLDVNMSRVSTASSYKLMLYVSMNQEKLFDHVYSNAFSYTNPNSPEALDDFDLYLNKRLETVTIDWENSENKRSNEFLIEVTNQDGGVVYKDAVEDITIENFSYLETDKELTVSLKQKVNGIWSLPCTKKVKTDSKYSISIITKEQTHTSLGQIECKTDGKSLLFLEMGADAYTREEEKTKKEYTIYSDKVVDFTLMNTYTYVKAVMLAPDGIYYEDYLDIYLDQSAPYINLYENYDRINVDKDSIVIVGETNSGSTVTVNGKKVEIDANGVFKSQVPLQLGENRIVINSTDKSGNSTERTVIVKRVENKYLDFSFKGIISLAIGLIISVVFIILAVIFFKKRKEV